jgi:hypothetical protein
MNNLSSLFHAIVRPTGDASTDARTYKNFYLVRSRTENYESDRIEVIGRLGEVVSHMYTVLYVNEPIAGTVGRTTDENIDILSLINSDPILLPFCNSKGIKNAFRNFASLIPLVFKNIKDLRAEFVIDPDVEGEQIIVFNLLIEGTPQNILGQEKMFYTRLKTLIQPKDRKYFSLVYSVI